MDFRERFSPLRAVLPLTLILSALGLYAFARPIFDAGLLNTSRKWQAFVGLGFGALLLLLALTILAWTGQQSRVESWFRTIGNGFQRLKGWNFLLFALVGLAFGLLIYGRLGMYLNSLYARLALFWLAALTGSFLLWAGGVRRSWAELLGAALMLIGVAYRICAYLPEISAYPFTLGWSEASRYYYASLYFSERIYGTAVPPTVLHPSRYLMQALPFLIPGAPLWLHRVWQILLWIGVTLLTSALIARRVGLSDRLRRAAFIAWAFLFIILGPVYYHLQIPVILVVWLFDAGKFWRSLVVVLLASAWAGISRVNWFPVPAMLAIALYLLERPVQAALPAHAAGGLACRDIIRYLIPPATWGVLGLGVAFGAQALYALVSGNPGEQFTSSFTSDLLWYRLFPNITFPLGILPAALLVSLPLVLLVLGRVAGRWRTYYPVRWSGLAAILLVLFAGGLVVSVKIGGGSNLHNLDAYMVLLMVVSSSIYFGRFCPDQAEQPGQGENYWANRPLFHSTMLALATLAPLYFILGSGSPATVYPAQRTQQALETIRTMTEAAARQGGEVLFISERQLLTFHNLQGVPLVPEYEKVFLMEMAMAGNPEYLEKFHTELKNHRFSLIISEPLFTKKKGTDEIFGEENDAWVRQVSNPVLCYYRPRKSLLTGVPIQILVPRSGGSDCP